MWKWLFLFLILSFVQLVLSGCIPGFPAPIVGPHNAESIPESGKPVKHTNVYYWPYIEKQLEKLIEESASRLDLVNRFGTPLHYSKEYVSYMACNKKYAYGEAIFELPVSDAAGKCYEVNVYIKSNDRIASFEKLELSANSLHSRCNEEKTYYELASMGDVVAYSLWVNTGAYEAQKQRISADQGDAESQFQVYLLDSCGTGRIKYLCRSADQKYKPAMRELANAYYEGNIVGIPQNRKRAYVWYSIAGIAIPLNLQNHMAQGEIAEAKRMLNKWEPGQCEKIYTDEAEHIRRLCLAADKGHTSAAMDLGRIYWIRDDVSDNRIKSYIWYTRAAKDNAEDNPYFNASIKERALIESSYKRDYVLTGKQLMIADQLLHELGYKQCIEDLLPKYSSNYE